MSIASEFDSTIENLKSDYEGLENLGADLTNVNKNIQNIRTCLDNIYSSLPKTTGEGSNLSLSTLKGRINVEDILGDTTQEGTPTPDSPQDIEVVTGEQEVLVQNKNLFKEATPFTPENINWKDNFGNLMGNVSAVESSPNYYDLIGGQTYTFKIDSYANIGNWQLVYISNNELASIAQKGTNVTDKKTFTPSTNMRVWYRNSNSDTTTQYYCKAQLELGSTASSYAPYQEQTKIVNLSSKNLFVGYANMNIGWLASSGAYPTSNASYPNARYQLIELKPTESITISNSTSQRARVRYIDYASNTVVGTVDSVGEEASTYYSSTASFGSGFTNGTITAKKHIYIGILVFEDREDISQTMINKGSTALPYEPYYNYELSKIGTYQDRIYKNEGKWYIEKNIGKVVLNGSETWDIGVTNVFYTTKITDYATSNNIPFANYYVGVTNVSGASAMGNQANNTTGFISVSGSTTPRLYIKDTSKNSSASTLATWLQTHNLTLYYALSTPTYTEITNETLIEQLNELEKIMSYNGQTNINISGNLPMLVSVSALKGE